MFLYRFEHFDSIAVVQEKKKKKINSTLLAYIQNES